MNAHAHAPRGCWMATFALCAAPAAWAAQGLLGWYLSSRGCPAPEHDAATLRTLQIALDLVFLAVAALGLAAGLRRWRALDRSERANHVPHDRRSFLATTAILVSAVFLLAVLWASLAPFVLPRCVSGR